MIVVIANSSNPDIRKTLYSGVVLFHPITKQLIACGKNAMSERILSDYEIGFRFQFQDKLNLIQTVEVYKKSLDSFIKHLPAYYAYASVNVVVQQWETDLTDKFLHLNMDLTISGSPAFERVDLV